MDYKSIVSQSGTTHYVNPSPTFQGFKPAGYRTQTLCSFHVDSRTVHQPNGDLCEFCDALATGKPEAASADPPGPPIMTCPGAPWCQ